MHVGLFYQFCSDGVILRPVAKNQDQWFYIQIVLWSGCFRLNQGAVEINKILWPDLLFIFFSNNLKRNADKIINLRSLCSPFRCYFAFLDFFREVCVVHPMYGCFLCQFRSWIAVVCIVLPWLLRSVLYAWQLLPRAKEKKTVFSAGM